MKRNIIMTALLTALTAMASAQTLTLQECLSRGLENNYSIRISRNQEQIDRRAQV